MSCIRYKPSEIYTLEFPNIAKIDDAGNMVVAIINNTCTEKNQR